jgi:hypothetical protein
MAIELASPKSSDSHEFGQLMSETLIVALNFTETSIETSVLRQNSPAVIALLVPPSWMKMMRFSTLSR